MYNTLFSFCNNNKISSLIRKFHFGESENFDSVLFILKINFSLTLETIY